MGGSAGKVAAERLRRKLQGVHMARVETYLNFERNTEEAFAFYSTVFGTHVEGPIMRFKDMPEDEPGPPIPDEDKNLIMHMMMPITGGHYLHGSDVPESMGFPFKPGNNVYIMLNLDNRAEADRLFDALSPNGSVEMEMMEMFWGDYFGSVVDKFGVLWMVMTESKT